MATFGALVSGCCFVFSLRLDFGPHAAPGGPDSRPLKSDKRAKVQYTQSYVGAAFKAGAGAGIKRGCALGKSDKTGTSPLKDPEYPGEPLASIHHAFGIGSGTMVLMIIGIIGGELALAGRAAATNRERLPWQK
ncbi:hypothetical protein P12x_002947 [Tundrisphaera lichenicola]|uniref:hypothetical protein n=1 Tax=Tundrisphaera lichenicola TaxID=2029860 RepID=UPI003EBAC2FC